MTSSRKITLVGLGMALLALVLGPILNPADAASKAKEPPPVDARILISAVNVPNKTVTFTYKRTRKKQDYIIDDLTAVTVENGKGTLADIKVGQQVFTYTERDAHSLDSITVGAADPAPTAKGK